MIMERFTLATAFCLVLATTCTASGPRLNERSLIGLTVRSGNGVPIVNPPTRIAGVDQTCFNFKAHQTTLLCCAIVSGKCASSHHAPDQGPDLLDSGYFTLDRTYEAKMFYFYFQARNPTPDTPVVLWMTGAGSDRMRQWLPPTSCLDMFIMRTTPLRAALCAESLSIRT